MKKKIGLWIVMLLAALSFTGCSGTKTELEYSEENLENVSEFLISYCASVDEAQIEGWNNMTEFALEQQLNESGLPVTQESFLGSLDSWQAGLDECGAYLEHGDYTFEATATEVRVTVPAKFEERDAEIEFVYDENLYLDSMTVSGKYSTAEILQKAGLNTLLGMGTVFIVLIFISIIIWLLKFIPALEQAFRGKKKQAPAQKTEAAAPAAPAVEMEEALTDDTELIAVITAAIAASEGTSGDGFVVRSIRRRPSNKWNA